MKRVGSRLGRQRVLFGQARSQCHRIFRYSKARNGLQRLLSFSDRLGIAAASFVRNQLRHVDLKMPAPLLPPLAGHLLVRRQDQVPARPRRQVTDDARLKVDPLLHVNSSPQHALEAPQPH